MESFITVHYKTTGINFQNRGSDSFLGFEEGHPHSKNHFLASKISKTWLDEKKCKNANNFNMFKALEAFIQPNKLCIKTLRPLLM